MQMFIELWKAKPAWEALGRDERAAYMEQVGAGVEQLAKAGVEVVAWGIVDEDTARRIDFDFFGVWKMHDKEGVKLFERTIQEAGWYEYMEQVNASGEMASPQEVIAHQVSQ
jgi:hypothetical protein